MIDVAELRASRVEQVELFEDRARITRAIDIPAGSSTVILDDLSPLVSEGRLGFDGDAEVLQVDIEREHRTRAATDSVTARNLHARCEALRAQLAAQGPSRVRSSDAAARASSVSATAYAWTGRALLAGQDGRAWIAGLQALENASLERALASAGAEVELERLGEELAFQEACLEHAREASAEHRSRMTLCVHGPAAGVLRVRYTIACALWRPVHRAYLQGEGVEWEAGAMCWNATGEDWRGVRLVCSTERPGEAAKPPILQDDTLRAHTRAHEIFVEARDEQIQVAREAGSRESSEILGVDDGGSARVYEAEETVDLPSDSRPVHVTLEQWSNPAESLWTVLPERDPALVLQSHQVNASAQPLLAGPVTLFRSGAAIGRATIGLVPAGERFTLGWGANELVVVSRRCDREMQTKAVTGRQSLHYSVESRIANLGDTPVEMQVRERIPVSELKEVEVTSPKANPTLSEGPDVDGMCTWMLRLDGHSERSVSLKFCIRAPSKVVLPEG